MWKMTAAAIAPVEVIPLIMVLALTQLLTGAAVPMLAGKVLLKAIETDAHCFTSTVAPVTPSFSSPTSSASSTNWRH
jgi:hypothetical protein